MFCGLGPSWCSITLAGRFWVAKQDDAHGRSEDFRRLVENRAEGSQANIVERYREHSKIHGSYSLITNKKTAPRSRPGAL